MIELEAAGLTVTEAKCYVELVRHADIAPAQMAKRIKETRSNTYKVLDSLVLLGLAEKFELKNKYHYRAINPQRLLELSRIRREEMLKQEKIMQEHVTNLSKEFYQTSDQPGIRFFQGKEGIAAMFEDQLNTGKDILLIRSPQDDALMGREFFQNFLKKRASLGINTYMLSPDVVNVNRDKKRDRLENIFRTWMPKGSYDAAVEWDIYGDKTAIISYGEETFGTIIESRQIAESLRQLFTIIKEAHTAID